MHYDLKSGAKNHGDIFSPLVVIIMAGSLLLFIAYATINYYSPDIFTKASPERIQRIESEANYSKPSIDNDILRIPSAGIDVGISDKLTDSNVWRKKMGSRILLASQKRSIGVTPTETMRNSPLFTLGKTNQGDKLYIDQDGTRTTYEVTSVHSNIPVSQLVSSDATIYSYEPSDASIAVVAIEARRVTIMK